MKILFILIQILLIISGYAEGNNEYSEYSKEDFDSLLSGLYSYTVDLISTSELAARMNSEENILIIDTRSRSEYDTSHIQGALFVDYENPNLLFLKEIPRSRQIILYCTVGYRSEKIGELVLEQGFNLVFNLYGGITQWVNDSYPIFNSEGETKIVHGYSEEWARWINVGEVIY